MEVLQILVKNMDTKKEIRRRIRTLRDQMKLEDVCKKSEQITEKVFNTNEFKQSQLVLVYADFRNEVQTHFIAEKAWEKGKKVAFPKVNGKEMDFYIVSEWSQLAPGAMNILEPISSCEKISSFTEDTLLIMPGVAYDRALNRVGYGGGYYDRFLNKHPLLHVIAIGYELQICNCLPVEATDIKPHMLITEKQILTAKE